MKLSIVIILTQLFGAVIALPTENPTANLTIRGNPDIVQVTFNNFPTNDHFICGERAYENHEVFIAAQYGVLLKADCQARGKADRKYPKGRFPHAFTFNPNKAPPLDFPADCPGGDNDQASYPLVHNGPFNGGPTNNRFGKDRVVYVYEEGQVHGDGHDLAAFCGLMTHTGAPKGAFVLCHFVESVPVIEDPSHGRISIVTG